MAFDFDWRAACMDAEQRAIHTQRDLERIRPLINALAEAIYNEGPNPKHHRKVMRNHRNEWPLLWKIIDELIEDYV